MTYLETKEKIEKFLEDNDFFLQDYTNDVNIYRQKNNDPKMDIEIKFIRHNDSL